MVSRSARAESTPTRSRRSGTRRSDHGPGEETVLVGKVLRPHGLRGELKIDVLSDVPERFAPGGELWLMSPGQEPRRVGIRSFRSASGGALLGLADCESRDQAEALRGSRLEVGLSEVPEAPEGLYYHHQLIGCRCDDEVMGELGEVVEVLEDGGGEILEIERPSGRRLLVPFVAALAVEVDVDAQRITLRLPAGLVDACQS